jgi:hypothetical protein
MSRSQIQKRLETLSPDMAPLLKEEEILTQKILSAEAKLD